MKLPRNLKGQAVADLNFRLKAAAAAAPDAQGPGAAVGPDAQDAPAPDALSRR